ncbi:MAG: hypothetical protein K6G23_08730 [Lachnospiraceae bacterium]|nr:hypothetical protein [Lachnospiraceae bacterium]
MTIARERKCFMREMPKELEDWANEHAAGEELLEAANRHTCRAVFGTLKTKYPDIVDSPELAAEDERKYHLLREQAAAKDKTLMGRRINDYLDEVWPEIVAEAEAAAEKRFREDRLQEHNMRIVK